MGTIVVTSSYPSFEGDPAGHFVRSEVLELREHGEHVEVLQPAVGGAFGWPGVASRLQENPLRIVEVGRFWATVRRQLAARQPARVIAHWALPCGIAAHSGRWELEVVSHGADVRLLCAIPEPLRRVVAKRLIERATKWRFVSESLRETLMRALPSPLAAQLKAKSTVAPSPLRMGTMTSLPPKDQGETRLVWVGRLVESKNLDSALYYVSRKQRGAHLVVVGDGPSRRAHERTASALGLRASFIGRVPRPEALAWIASADTLLMSSKAEGLSTVVREAEVLGTPVLWV